MSCCVYKICPRKVKLHGSRIIYLEVDYKARVTINQDIDHVSFINFHSSVGYQDKKYLWIVFNPFSVTTMGTKCVLITHVTIIVMIVIFESIIMWIMQMFYLTSRSMWSTNKTQMTEIIWITQLTINFVGSGFQKHFSKYSSKSYLLSCVIQIFFLLFSICTLERYI